jgi:signal transduction histidine kinase
VTNAERIGHITKGFAELTQASAAKRGPVDLNQVARAAAQDVEDALMRGNIVLQLDLAPDLPLVHGHPGQLQQVLRMLLTNAVEAIGAGDEGWIRITTQHLNEEVVLAVSDSGPGIAPADLQRVFEPSFTTKITDGTVRGIGLGLFTAQAIIQAHDGTIEVESTTGEGTTFVIRLPVMAE